jgi:hypothetical protein
MFYENYVIQIFSLSLSYSFTYLPNSPIDCHATAKKEKKESWNGNYINNNNNRRRRRSNDEHLNLVIEVKRRGEKFY